MGLGFREKGWRTVLAATALPVEAAATRTTAGDQSPPSSMREQDRFLLIANIGRIMKKGLPANGKIAKDTVQECVSEFISFVTSEASDKCQKEKRKTINGDDLMWAMATLGFEEFLLAGRHQGTCQKRTPLNPARFRYTVSSSRFIFTKFQLLKLSNRILSK